MARTSTTSLPKKPQKKRTKKEQPEKLKFTIEIKKGQTAGNRLYGEKYIDGIFDYIVAKCNRREGTIHTPGFHSKQTSQVDDEINENVKRRWEYIKLHAGQVMLDAFDDLVAEASLFANPEIDLNKEIDGSLDLRAMPGPKGPHSITTLFQAQVAYIAEQKQARLMGWDDRTIKAGRKNGIDATQVLRAMRMYFTNCHTACNEIRAFRSLSARKAKAQELDLPDDLLKALNEQKKVMDSAGNLKTERHSYTPRQVAYVWMMRKEGVKLPMWRYKAIERTVKEIGSPAGYHAVRVVVRTPDSR